MIDDEQYLTLRKEAERLNNFIEHWLQVADDPLFVDDAKETLADFRKKFPKETQ